MQSQRPTILDKTARFAKMMILPCQALIADNAFLQVFLPHKR
jgi:hypothetical protein